MKKVISTKVDQVKYAELLQYCARRNKYIANALEDALDLLLSSDKLNVEKNLEQSEFKQKAKEVRGLNPKIMKEVTKEPEANVDEDEIELE